MTGILVTGAAGDIGRATARTLAIKGHRLLLADHPDAEAALEQVVEECRTLGAEADALTFSVTDDAAVDAAVGGRQPLLGAVNCAGYQGEFVPLERYPLDDARQVFAVNVVGVMAVLAAAARSMIRGGRGGSIVNVASMAGVSGAPNMPAYSASKAAVIGLTKAAAKDLARHGIRVNAVSPGFIGPGRMWETQVARQAEAGGPYATDPDAVAAQMIGLVPLGRYGSPSEVGDAIAFLLSDAASYLTGINLEVAGGGG